MANKIVLSLIVMVTISASVEIVTPQCCADTIYLKSGAVFENVLCDEEGDRVLITRANGGKFTLPKEAIKKIEKHELGAAPKPERKEIKRAIEDEPTAKDEILDILIDISVAWSFNAGDIGSSLANKSECTVHLCEAAITPLSLERFDIVIVVPCYHEDLNAEGRITALKRYVGNGGGLILFGDPRIAPHAKALVRTFGFDFMAEKGEAPLRLRKHDITKGLKGFDQPEEFQNRAPGLLAIGKKSQVILTDRWGNPALAVRKFGKGRVAALGDGRLISPKFSLKGPDGSLYGENLRRNLFKWLSQMDNWDTSKKGLKRIVPEHTIELGHITIRYSSALGKDRVRFLIKTMPKVYDFVESYLGDAPVSQLDVRLLACGVGGFSGGKNLGIGVMSSPENIISVVGHEMSHTWLRHISPPPWFNERFSSLVGMRAVAVLGYRENYLKARANLLRLLKEAERQKKVDMAKPEHEDTTRLYSKTLWFVEALEKEFGNDFIKRYLEIKNARAGFDKIKGLTFDDMIWYMSITADKDLFPWFRRIGTTVNPRPLPDPAETQRLVEEYRANRALARKAEEKRKKLLEERESQKELRKEWLKEYEKLKRFLTADNWRDEWELKNNSTRYKSVWIDHFKEGSGPNPGRSGILTVYPYSPTRPCQLVRTVQLEKDSHPLLCIGVSSRYGTRHLDAILRVKVNDKQIDEVLIDSGGSPSPYNWYHLSYDLSDYNGQQVTISVETAAGGPTHKWFGEELYYDYLMILDHVK